MQFSAFHIQTLSPSLKNDFKRPHCSITRMFSGILDSMRGTRFLSTNPVSKFTICFIELLMIIIMQKFLIHHFFPNLILLFCNLHLEVQSLSQRIVYLIRAQKVNFICFAVKQSSKTRTMSFNVFVSSQKVSNLLTRFWYLLKTQQTVRLILIEIIMEMRKKVSNGQIRVKEFLDHLMQETNVQIFRRQVNHLCQQPIASEITSKEYQSIEQIRATSPNAPYCPPEDRKPKRLPTDTIRPFSAKVHHRPKTPKIQLLPPQRAQGGHQRNTSNRSLMATNRTLTASSKNIRRQPKIATFDSINEKIIEQRLIALNINVEEDDENDKLIDKLRKIKLQAEEYEKQKQNFMKQIDKDREEYAISQKKLVSTLSRKDYTYSYNGAIVEIGKNKGTIKKKSRNMQAMKNGTRKSETDPSNSEKILINYNSTEFKNERKKYIFHEKEDEKNQERVNQMQSRNVKFCLLPEGEE